MKRLFRRIAVLPIAFSIGIFAAGAVTGTAVAAALQIHMYNALHDLQTAQAELQQATTNKQGYRVAALKSVAQAISQVQAGIQAAQ